MSRGPAPPRFHDIPRDGMPMDAGLFWEPDLSDLVRRLHDSEADRALRLTRIEEIWADRTGWIERYNALDAALNVLMRERDALNEECAGLRRSVVHARDLRAREQLHLARDRAAVDIARSALMTERDAGAAGRDALIAERDTLAAQLQVQLANEVELQDHLAAMEADRDAVRVHRDALAADRDIVLARAEAMEAKLAVTGRSGVVGLIPGRLRRVVKRMMGA